MKEKDLTKEIFELSCPFDNIYQGQARRVLFVCSAGLLRSATAANYFGSKGWNTRACGSEDYALIPVSVNLLVWAHRIYFMGKRNLESVKEKFKDNDLALVQLRKSEVLNIPDSFEYNNKDLIKLLDEKIPLE